jgi:hypothetical protein
VHDQEARGHLDAFADRFEEARHSFERSSVGVVSIERESTPQEMVRNPASSVRRVSGTALNA